ncbi:MAG: hypothetical protein U0872_00550 [Planctomycetaceae bacterium]
MQQKWISRLTSLPLVAALLLTAGMSALQAQPPADPPQPVAQPGSSGWERLVYIPYRNLKAVFDKDGAAFLPYHEYLQLMERALLDKQHPPTRPPVAGVITSSNYVGQVAADVVNITATLEVQSLTDGWAEVPLRFGEAAIGELKSDSGKVLLRGNGPGAYSLLLPNQGVHRVTLELVARVRTSPEGNSLEIEIPPVGITNFELTVPEANQSVDLTPKLIAENVAGTDKETRIKVSVGSTDRITARWHSQTGSKPEMQLLANATAATLISAENGLLHTDAWLQYEVLRGQMDKVRIALPKGQRILDVTSEAKVKSWSTADEANRQILTVEFLSRISGKATVEVHLERDLPSDAFDAGGLADDTASGLHALDVVRESGQIAVRSSDDVALTVERQQSIQRLEESEADPRIRRPNAMYFKYYSPAITLKLQARPVEPRLQVDHTSEIQISEDRFRTIDQFHYRIDRAGVFELRFKIPPGISIENVTCDRLKQFDVSPDQQTLTLALRDKVLGELNVTITGSRTADFAALAAEQPLPILEPLGVELENGRVIVNSSEAIEVVTEISQIVAAQSAPAGLSGSGLAWIYNRRPVTIPARLVRKPTRLTAHVNTTLDVKQGQVQVKTQLAYDVAYAGLNTFRFSVPAPYADLVQITAPADGPAIKQKSRATDAVDGWVPWTIVMQRDVTGRQEFTVTYDLTPQIDAATQTEQAQVELLRVLDPFPDEAAAGSRSLVTLSRILGEVTAVKDRALSVNLKATGGDVEAIDVRELTQLTEEGFIAFRYFKRPVSLQLSSEKFLVKEVMDVVVSRALVEVVVDRAGTAAVRARYVLKSSERQRLPLALPTGSEILGVSVDRKSVALENSAKPEKTQAWESHLVNIARTKSSEEPFSLAVMYRVKLDPPPFKNYGGPLHLRLPILKGQSSEEAAVQQLRVAVWLPDDYALVGAPHHFTLDSRPKLRGFFLGQRPAAGSSDLESWIGADAGGIFDFPTAGRRYVYSSFGNHEAIEVQWWHLPFYTWIISGAVVAMALVLRGTHLENKLTLLLIGAFLVAAYALTDQDTIVHGLAAASYGLVIAAAIWLVHGLTGRKSPSAPTPPPASSEPPPAAQPA